MSTKSQNDPYQNFRDLLNKNHQFPCHYLHKFIGKNSNLFLTSVSEFEKKFIGLTYVGKKESSSGKHVSFTYSYHAANADDVIQLASETQKINDVIYVL